MFKKLRHWFKDFFYTPRIGDVTPSYLREEKPWRLGNMTLYSHTAEDIHRDRMESISLANMALQKKAAQHTLKIQHRTMIITMLAVIVAMFSSAVAIVITLNQPTPNIMVELKADEQKTIHKTN